MSNGTNLNPADYFETALNVAQHARLPWTVKDQADGIAAEALVKACQSYDSNATDAMAPEGYIRVKVRQALTDATRKHLTRRKDENKTSVVSLSTLTHTDDEGGTCEYNVADGAANDPEVRITLERVVGRLNTADEKKIRCLRLYVEGWKLKEIGAEVGVSESRVCQILSEVRKHLQCVA